MDLHARFNKIAGKVAKTCGSMWVFFAALGLIVGWLLCGYAYDWSERHQLFINTVTTIITFLMVFIIQNSQSRDSQAIQLKLDEMIRGQRGSRNDFIRIEVLDEKNLKKLQEEMQKVKSGEIIIKSKRNDTIKNSRNQTAGNPQQSMGAGTLDS